MLALAGSAPLAIADRALPTDAAAWHHRIQQAASSVSYQGTVVVHAAGGVSSARVMRLQDGRQRLERSESLDGEPRLQWRLNQLATTVWPQSKRAQTESLQDAVAEFPALPAAADAAGLANYEMTVTGRERVAGRDADVLWFKPRDRLRFAQRLWADQATGLLLRIDTVGPQAEVLESASFSDVQVGWRAPAEPLIKAMKRLDGYRVVHAESVRTTVAAEGWHLSHAVAGFDLISCSKRPLDPGGDAGSRQQVIQAVFSDGLAHVSVFIEPYDAHRHKASLSTTVGATHTMNSRRGDWWLTVVGEVPAATIQALEAIWERRA